jgi:hypothetical protein
MTTRLAKSARKHAPELRAVIGITGWLVSDRILGLAAGDFVGLRAAGYLGPEWFGLLRLCKMDGSSAYHL